MENQEPPKETENASNINDQQDVKKPVEEEACQDHKEINKEKKQESNNSLDEQSSPGTVQNTTCIKSGSKSPKEKVEHVIESRKSLEKKEPAEENVSENEEHEVESAKQETLDKAANKIEPENGNEKIEISVASKVTIDDTESLRINEHQDLAAKEQAETTAKESGGQQGKARRSILKIFDPLYLSPKTNHGDLQIPQTIIDSCESPNASTITFYSLEPKVTEVIKREELKEDTTLIKEDDRKELKEQLKEAKARESKAIAQLCQKNKDILNYEKIMENYDKTIATRYEDYKNLNEEHKKLNEEHKIATRHLANIELAFSDLHEKYEKAKTVILAFKSSQDTLEEMCKQHEARYLSLKSHAHKRIENANKEILLLRDKYEEDVKTLKTVIKRLEIKCGSLEASLQRTSEECAGLSALYDEVMGKKM